MTWEFEQKAWAAGYSAVCGVDEAGRSPIAGPVCAAAVILPGGIQIEGLNDSEKAQREKAGSAVRRDYGERARRSVSLVDEKTIDEINILQATYRAMRQAVEGLTVQPTSPMWMATAPRGSACRMNAWSRAMRRSHRSRRPPFSPR